MITTRPGKVKYMAGLCYSVTIKLSLTHIDVFPMTKWHRFNLWILSLTEVVIMINYVDSPSS